MDEDAVAPDAWSIFVMNVFAVNGLIIRAGEHIARPVGQTSARWQVLGRLSRPSTVSALARDIGITRQSVQRVADILAAERLVSYRPHPNDRRTKLLELTAAGWTALGLLHQRQLAWWDSLGVHLDHRAITRASGDLEAVASVLRRELERGHRTTDPTQEEPQ